MGRLTINFVDVYESPLSDVVDIYLENQTLQSDRHRLTIKNLDGTLNIEGLQEDANGLYRLEIDPMTYAPESEFIRMPASGSTSTTVMFPVNISKVAAITIEPFTSFTTDVMGLLDASVNSCAGAPQSCATGEALFSSWTDIQKAGFLNIVEKSRHTPFLCGKTAINYYLRLRQVLGDRFFVEVDPALVSDTADGASAGLFYPVPDVLHAPPPNFVHDGSYKTQDRYGNLQLTFHRSTTDGTILADVDIDDAAGFEHFFQVLGNALTGKPTHPYNIHELLVGFQKIFPKYTLSIAQSSTLKIV